MNWEKPKTYAVRHIDDFVRADSRSGGVFTALSDLVLSEQGVIYGCILTENLTASHIRAENKEIRNKMRGSKYIPSKLGETFKNVKVDLDNGRKVLFSGTSCQVAGLKKYLNKEYKNLLCIDIVCHGVPSPNVWKSYIAWQEDNNKSTVVNVNFRNKKKYGWRDHVETLQFQNGKTIDSRVFSTLFYGHCILRPSCYTCPYKDIMHPGDITIADYWGIEKAAPEFDDNKGVSLVLVNNEIGENVLNQVKEMLMWKETKLEDSMQPPLIESFPKPKKWKRFWLDYERKTFNYIVKKYGGECLLHKVKVILRKIKKRVRKIKQ